MWKASTIQFANNVKALFELSENGNIFDKLSHLDCMLSILVMVVDNKDISIHTWNWTYSYSIKWNEYSIFVKEETEKNRGRIK